MAPELFDSAAFGPDALKVSGRAFDEAWANIAGSFYDPLTVQATRLKLANPIPAAGKANGPDDVGLSRGKGPPVLPRFALKTGPVATYITTTSTQA
jgi:hypothetical protein